MSAERMLVIAGEISLLVGCVALALRWRTRPPAYDLAAAAAATASALFVAALAVRWLREAQGPFLTMYEVLLSNLFSLSLVFAACAWRWRSIRRAGGVVLPVLATLGMWLLTLPTLAVPLPATFDNGWLWAHLVSGKLFLGLTFVATGLALMLLANRDTGGDTRTAGSGDERMADTRIWQLLSVAFVCQCAMLVTGSVWAHDAWGRYWAWDPLETSAFVTWLAMGAVLHARLTFSGLPRRAAWLMAAGVFALAFLTFLGVPFVSSTPHSGFVG